MSLAQVGMEAAASGRRIAGHAKPTPPPGWLRAAGVGTPGAAGLLRFPSPPLEAPSGRGEAGGCGGAGRRRGERGERACPRGGGAGAAGGGELG